MIAARLHALGGGKRRPVPTGACELDMELLLSSGALDVPARRSLRRALWRRLRGWLRGRAS